MSTNGAKPLNRKQRAVMGLLHHRAKNPGGIGYAFLTTGKTEADPYTAYINWQTADALEQRGLIDIHESGDIYIRSTT